MSHAQRGGFERKYVATPASSRGHVRNRSPLRVRKVRGTMSEVWEYFDKQGSRNGVAPARVVCNLCGKSFARWDAHTSMRYHLIHTHNKKLRDDSAVARRGVPRWQRGQRTLTQMLPARVDSPTWKKYAAQALRAVVSCKLPLSFFEHSGRAAIAHGPATMQALQHIIVQTRHAEHETPCPSG